MRLEPWELALFGLAFTVSILASVVWPGVWGA